MITLALALALAQSPKEHSAPAPGPRAAIAGLAGLHAVSRLDFADRRMRLTVTYVFPDRARWSLEEVDAPVPKSEQFYRRGSSVHRLAFGESSQELEGLQRAHVLLQMELRRAALLYPDGCEWKSAADGARESEIFADSCCRREPLGTLRASEAGGRVTLAAHDLAGELRETLTIESSEERDGRRFPSKLSATGVNADFRETIESLETRVHYLDLAFTPGDRRRVGPAPDPSQRLEDRIVARDLVPMSYVAQPLAGAATWEDALARAQALRPEVQKSLPAGLGLDPVATFELGPDGRPLRCLVRLAKACDPPPEGFVTHGERLGLFMSLEGTAKTASALARLAAAVPEGARAGEPYVRVHGPTRVELVLPLIPR
ncbi:MAG: hypothetical protein ABL998_14150 [Planctomycetota bacterium]